MNAEQYQAAALGAGVVLLAWWSWRRGGDALGDALDTARLASTDAMAEMSGLNAHQERLLSDPRYAAIESAGIDAWRWPWELDSVQRWWAAWRE